MIEILLSGAAGALMVWGLQVLTERRRRRYERRLFILRALMTNAANVVSVEFVSAFNMILIEYGSKTEVRKWHAAFIEHVSQPTSQTDDEAKQRNNKFNDILIHLIEALAKSIHIKIEQLDVQNKIYWPQGFSNAAETQQKLTGLLVANQDSWNTLLTQALNKDTKLELGVKHTKKKTKKSR